MFYRPDHLRNETLYCVTTIFNPQRYRSRWKLYTPFEKHALDNGAYLVTIECTFGERSKVIVEQKSERHMIIHVRTKHELWIKENLINLAIQRLPEDWKYVCWVDADVTFARPDWVGETLHKLQHFHLIQMFSEAIDLSPSYEIVTKFKSWMWCHHNEIPDIPDGNYYGKPKKGIVLWHPGFAWAARRESIDHLGGLIDWGILGSADRHMAAALIGKVRELSFNFNATRKYKLSEGYLKMLDEWQNRATKYIKRNVGCMDGLMLHYWHGKKANRGYKDRWKILIENDYDPNVDIKRDSQGVWQLTDRSHKLRDEIRKYFSDRNEDSIDL